MSESVFAWVHSMLGARGEGKKNGSIWLTILLFLVLAVLFLSLSTCQEEKKTDVVHSEEAEALSAWREVEEKKLSELICRLEGVEQCYVGIHFSKGEESIREGSVTVSFSPACVGSVVILYEGQRNLSVKEKIVNMVTTLYQIGSNRVSVANINLS